MFRASPGIPFAPKKSKYIRNMITISIAPMGQIYCTGSLGHYNKLKSLEQVIFHPRYSKAICEMKNISTLRVLFIPLCTTTIGAFKSRICVSQVSRRRTVSNLRSRRESGVCLSRLNVACICDPLHNRHRPTSPNVDFGRQVRQVA